MHPTTYLEWFFKGEWQQIGWPASTPQSAAHLRAHGERLAAASGGSYRLVQPGHLADHPPVVVHEFAAQCKGD